MIIRGFFTTFLMKQSLGKFGFGKAALGSGLLEILLMTVNFDFSNTKLSISGHSVIRVHSAQEILLDNLSLLSELKNLKIPASLDDKAWVWAIIVFEPLLVLVGVVVYFCAKARFT